MGALKLLKSKRSSEVTKEKPDPFAEYKKLQLTRCSVCRGKEWKLHALLKPIRNINCDVCGRVICTECASRIYRRKGTRRYYCCCPFCLAKLANDRGGLKVYTD